MIDLLVTVLGLLAGVFGLVAVVLSLYSMYRWMINRL
jgi:preprotein translocase subunit SecD